MTGAEDSEGDDLRRRVRRMVPVTDVDGCRELVAAMAADGGFVGEVARCERWADDVIAAAEGPEGYPAPRWFAGAIKRNVEGLRAALDRGDALAAAMAVHAIGKLQQEVNDRGDWGEAAKHGAKVTRQRRRAVAAKRQRADVRKTPEVLGDLARWRKTGSPPLKVLEGKHGIDQATLWRWAQDLPK